MNVLARSVTAIGTGTAVAIPSGTFPRNVIGIVSGSGSVSATVEIYGGNDAASQPVLLATISLSGTTTDSAADGIEVPYGYMRADVTAISGTGAAVTVTTGY